MLYSQGELEKEATCTEIIQVQKEGGRTVRRPLAIYNLDVIISLGYRINSKRGIAFRRWANSVLKQYLIEGYTLNEKRLQVLGRTVEVQRALLTHYVEGSGADADEIRYLSPATLLKSSRDFKGETIFGHMVDQIGFPDSPPPGDDD